MACMAGGDDQARARVISFGGDQLMFVERNWLEPNDEFKRILNVNIRIIDSIVYRSSNTHQGCSRITVIFTLKIFGI